MRSHRLFAVFGSLALFTFAGCIGEETPTLGSVPAAPPPQATPTTGSLTGTIVSWDYVYLEGAVVTLHRDGTLSGEAQTDAQGRFTLNDLAPASYRVDTLALGFAGTSRQVDIVAGDVTELNIVLDARPNGNVSYMVPDQWNGFLGCGAGMPGFSLSLCSDLYEEYGLDENDDFVQDIEVGKGIREIVFGATWKQAGGVSAQRLLFDVYIDQPGVNPTTPWVLVGSGKGESPVVFRMNDTTMTAKDDRVSPLSSIQDTKRLQIRAYVPRDLDVPVVVYQQPFTVYWEEYYGVAAPPDRDPIPDQ